MSDRLGAGLTRLDRGKFSLVFADDFTGDGWTTDAGSLTTSPTGRQTSDRPRALSWAIADYGC